MTQDESLEEVIADGINFMQSLTKHYGNERGMEIWETIGEAVGREIKGKIFFAMINGSHNNRMKFTADLAEYKGNSVSVIKTIRQYTGLGLKEAKDIWVESKGKFVTIDADNDSIKHLREELRALGCRII